MKERIKEFLKWSFSPNERLKKFYKKYLKFEYLIGFVYVANAIVAGIAGDFPRMIAYMVVTMFVGIMFLKNKIIDGKQEIIDMQKELIDSMLGLIDEMEKRERLRNSTINKN